jgi:hypothetical protein
MKHGWNTDEGTGNEKGRRGGWSVDGSSRQGRAGQGRAGQGEWFNRKIEANLLSRETGMS